MTEKLGPLKEVRWKGGKELRWGMGWGVGCVFLLLVQNIFPPLHLSSVSQFKECRFREPLDLNDFGERVLPRITLVRKDEWRTVDVLI